MVIMFALIVSARSYEQNPVLPTSGSWGTYGNSQTIKVNEGKDDAYELELRTKPEKKVVQACHYTTEVQNKSAKTVSFVLEMVSPMGISSSDKSKVKLGPGEKTEISYMIGACKNSEVGGEDKKYNGCCSCSFEFNVVTKSVK